MSNKLDIAGIRTDYQLKELHEGMVKSNPIEQFNIWFEEAIHSEVMEPNAMCLSTSTDSGKPSSRIVLLKGVDELGFSFFTNYHSIKGQMIEANPWVALNFFWPELQRQVRIIGKADKLSAEASDEYFESRPRASQIGAWASDQSDEVRNREYLDKKYEETLANFENKEVFRPPHWGGYLVQPEQIEFWQGRASRMHDRIEYVLEDGDWRHHRLAP